MAASHQLSPAANQVDWHQLQGIAAYLQQKTSVRPKVGIICGSGLGGLAEQLDADNAIDRVPYEEVALPRCSGKMLLILLRILTVSMV